MSLSQNNPFANHKVDVTPPEDDITDPTPEPEEAAEEEALVVTEDAPLTVPYHFPHVDGPRLEGFDETIGRIRDEVVWESASAYTGVDTANSKTDAYPTGLFPPTMPVWQRATELMNQCATLADRIAEQLELETFTHPVEASLPHYVPGATVSVVQYDPTHPLMVALKKTAYEASAALKESAAAAEKAASYKDPDTGFTWLQLIRAKKAKDRVDEVVRATEQWESSTATAGRPLPTLDGVVEGPSLIDGLLPYGGTALVVGPASSGKTTLAWMLAEAVADGRPFLGHEVAAEDVVIIDTISSAASLLKQYGHVRDDGGKILPFRGRAQDLDFRNPAVRQWLSKGVPSGSLLIIDSLPVILGALEINEVTAEAGALLSGLDALVLEADLAGVVVVHASPTSDPTRPRGHGSVAAWPSSVWTVAAARGKHTLSTFGPEGPLKFDIPDPDSDTAEPGEEEDGVPSHLLAAIEANPGKSSSFLSKEVGISNPTACKHLDRLRGEGKVKRKVSGRSHLWTIA